MLSRFLAFANGIVQDGSAHFSMYFYHSIIGLLTKNSPTWGFLFLFGYAPAVSEPSYILWKLLLAQRAAFTL